MNVKKCFISATIVAVSVSSFISTGLVKADDINYYKIGDSHLAGGECFANNMKGDFIIAENNWCPTYDKKDNTPVIPVAKKKKKNKHNNNSTTTVVVVVVTDDGNNNSGNTGGTTNNGGNNNGGNDDGNTNNNGGNNGNNGGNGGGEKNKACHNKNDNKDNNHTDCNAGKGND